MFCGCPRPDRFALRILLFRALRNFFPSSPGACLQAIPVPKKVQQPKCTLSDFNSTRPKSQLQCDISRKIIVMKKSVSLFDLFNDFCKICYF